MRSASFVPYQLSNVILGTAQLGLDYGVSNKSGLMNSEEAHALLEAAHRSGVSILDTAQAYGGSETLIGQHANSIFQVQTKVGPFPSKEPDWSAWLEAQVVSSQLKLRNQDLNTVFFHDTSQLLGEESGSVRDAVSNLLSNQGDIQIGASLYDPSEWEAIKKFEEISVYQLPYSLFDTRFETTGVLEEMTQMGKKVQARSIFLQGLLLMNLQDVPKYFDPWRTKLSEFHAFCKDAGILPVGAAAAFVLQNSSFDGVVIGFHSKNQLIELTSQLSIARSATLKFPSFENLSLNVLDPRKWTLS
jgi:aryl-alcohol dehydrogenase-like predicted oxidoreductase